MNKLTKLDIKFQNINQLQLILGNNDKNLNMLNNLLGVEIYTRGEEIFTNSNDKELIMKLEDIIKTLIEIAKRNIIISERDIIYISKLCETRNVDELVNVYTNRKEITKTLNGKSIYAKTINQRIYINSIEKNDLVFSIGPAGTGKTYLAVIQALAKLKKGSVKKIILTRPAVEAGESLGFLPGDLKEKIDPYLRPLYDAIYEVLGVQQTEAYIEKGIIEIAPLAYMRGRTLENSYVILDEAQNTTVNQMKLFLTRLGFNSKMVVTGDISQIDLPRKVESGLVRVINILKDVDGIEIIEFDRVDVIRHPLVQKVLKKFEQFED